MNSKFKVLLAAAAMSVIFVGGCGGPSASDHTARELVGEANLLMWEANNQVAIDVPDLYDAAYDSKLEPNADIVAQALDKYNQAIKHSQDSRDSDEYAEAYFRRGLVYLRTGKLEEAADDFGMAIRLDSGHAKAYYFRAKARETVGEKAKAEADLQEAQRLDPTLKPRPEGEEKPSGEEEAPP